MGLLSKIRDRFSIDWNNIGDGPTADSIDAIDHTKKRRVPSGSVRHMDDSIGDRKRKTLTLSGRSATTNFEVAAWAVRKHLDFVASMSFRMRTGIESFDRDVESFVEWWSRPRNFDVSGRHSLRKCIRMAEALRCLDGDVFGLKISDGRVQWIEGDRVKTPPRSRTRDFNEERTYNGVETTESGRPRRYALHSRRRGGGLDFARWIDAENIFPHGFYTRFDQVRGLSPITPALGRFQDIYEGFDYALQRAKVAQLFGLALMREQDEGGFGPVEEEDSDGDGTADRFDVKLGNRPIILDMNPGDDAKFLENKTPAPEFQAFENTMIAVALKALDIPFSFFDESFTNFFGSKAGLTLYLQSVRDKREDVKELLRKLTIWRLRLAIQDGEIVLPRSIQTIEDIRFAWIPQGIPWLDPRDIRGDIDAINSGLKTRTQVRMERFGDDWIADVAPELEAEQLVIETLGLSIASGKSAPPAPAPKEESDESDETESEEDEQEESESDQSENQ